MLVVTADGSGTRVDVGDEIVVTVDDGGGGLNCTWRLSMRKFDWSILKGEKVHC